MTDNILKTWKIDINLFNETMPMEIKAMQNFRNNDAWITCIILSYIKKFPYIELNGDEEAQPW